MKNSYPRDKNIVYIFILICSILVGSRPISIGTDTIEYYYMYQNASRSNLLHLIGNMEYGSDITIKLIFYFVSFWGSFNLALIIISFLIFVLTYKFAQKFVFYLGHGSSAFLFFFICTSFSFLGMQINVIRIGLAMSMVLLFTICVLLEKKFQVLIWAILALLTHFSTIVPILLIITVKYLPISVKTYRNLFCIAIIMSALGIGLLSFFHFGAINFSKIQNYTSNIDSSTYTVGFRPLFVIFNLIFYCLFVKTGGKGVLFNILLKYYLASSILFFLWFQIPYSDRVGAFSWYFIPIILFCGIITSDHKNKAKLCNYTFGGYFFLNLVI